ncbi:expressed unknown protein [Seminavis robusta]|uniref:Uncharacterized protein n=1 Tax=Seminavis robusta TaxID=568900 RepID=A0A9N8HGA3_9STRA|nr:expressed unknown protein [Seminavis robusta]|eukprot:Sro474_g150171.1  (140) ;mRNA; f:3009-3428
MSGSMSHHSHQERRHLQVDRFIDGVADSIAGVFRTPVAAWDLGQWFVALTLVVLTLSCCGCGRRRIRRRYYYGRSSNQPGVIANGGNYSRYEDTTATRGGRDTSFLHRLLLCVCCFEWCCRDCQDVPCIGGPSLVEAFV